MESLLFFTRIWMTVTYMSLAVRTMHQYKNTLHCDSQKYEYSGQCCHKCPPGTHVTARCTSIANTNCSPCGPNEYMSVWNDDLTCSLHMVCDPGKALHVLQNGNSTYPRQCVCTEGYHFDTRHDICMENVNCPAGFGVQSPVERNKNTICTPCLVGYYSNNSSATEQCTSWTNCTDAGLDEVVPGTNISDAVCSRRIVTSKEVIILTAVIILVIVIGICCIYIMCCRNGYSRLKVRVQEWVQGKYDQLCGSEKKNLYSGPVKLETKNTAYMTISNSCVGGNSELLCSDDMRESEVHQGRMVPTEDEYMDQRRSSEPENGSMIAGMDSSSCGSLGTFPGFSDTSSDRLLSPSQEEGVSIPLYSPHHCGQSAKAMPRKWTDENCTTTGPMDNVCGHCASQHTFHIFSQPAEHTPERNEEPCSHCTDSQYTRSRSSPGGCATTDTPPSPSGNVTGNNNTTVISCAPVMNIKTDVVVVYYNASNQDPHTAPENEENMRRPMQEESQSHYDSFVANTQSPRYTDIPGFSGSDADHLRDPDSPVIISQEQCDIMFCQNTDFLPVQEEGKPEFYHSEIV